VSSQQLFLWANLEPDATQAQNIQATVKAKYDETTWLQVGKSLNDKLRSSSRDALIACILSQAAGLGMTIDGDPITTADQLYEFFLIDVQMGTCMETSRIVQANAAIQQFVQRCLLGLESQLDANGNQAGVEPSWIDSTVWAWMHNYRLWEANREVFLYPENYLVPTLRDGMTPPFRDLMDSLLQNPITDENVTQAYQDYLYALNDVSQLQICGTFWENHTPVKTAVGAVTGADNQDSSAISTLHVFGRTTSTQTQSSGSATNPQPQYYYRRLTLTLNYQNEGLTVGTWTPWERVNPQIPGNHLIPVIWAGRLYLFWPTFSQTSVASAQSTTASGAAAPNPSANDLQIGLSWSEYRQGSWTATQSSPYSLAPIPFNPFSGNLVIDYSQFIFYAIPLEPGGVLLVGVMDVEQTGQNELQNPTFVADASTSAPPWTWNGAPFTVSFTNEPGKASISSDSLVRNSPNITSESIPAAAGQTWTASIFVDKIRFTYPYPDSNNPGRVPYVLTAVITMQFFTSSGGIIAGGVYSNQMTVTCQSLPTSGGDTYQAVNQILQVSGTAPVAAATVHMQVTVQSQRENTALYFFSSASLSQDIQPGLGDFIVSFTPQANSSSTSLFTNTAIQCPVPGAQFSYMWIQGSGPLSFGQPRVPPFITDPRQYQLTFPQDLLFGLLSTLPPSYSANPFFLSDSQRAYFVVTTSMTGRSLVGNKTYQGPPYILTGQILGFSEHWHPFTASFIQTLNWFGVPGLLTLAN
ncbi:MAG TPA: neuraminidase-like domain-containing protein, partial [Ktedonobacteraceae bacterium]